MKRSTKAEGPPLSAAPEVQKRGSQLWRAFTLINNTGLTFVCRHPFPFFGKGLSETSPKTMQLTRSLCLKPLWDKRHLIQPTGGSCGRQLALHAAVVRPQASPCAPNPRASPSPELALLPALISAHLFPSAGALLHCSQASCFLVITDPCLCKKGPGFHHFQAIYYKITFDQPTCLTLTPPTPPHRQRPKMTSSAASTWSTTCIKAACIRLKPTLHYDATQ